MSPKSIVLIASIVIGLVVLSVVAVSLCGVKSPQENIVMQPVLGDARIVNKTGGLYWKGFAQTWSYPKNIEFRYNDEVGDGDKDKESIEVTFNDGGTAQISTYIRLQTPSTEEELLAFHQQFGGIQDNIKASIKAYMIDCMKSTAPLMSASENQSARKSEFRQLVEKQLRDGIYAMNLEEVIKKDATDTTGDEITIFKTTIKLKDGSPIIDTPSPLVEKFHLTLVQFSVTGTDYDIETRKQFAAKKTAYLGAEQAKAERSKEVQERLMIEEKGKREKAEAEAAANVLMATAVIEAELKYNVAIQAKLEKETEAEMALSVAEISKQEAQINLEIAKIDAEAIVELAKAEQEKIRLAGAITELELALIDAEVKIKIGQAEHFSKIAVPSTVIGGSTGGNGERGSNVLQDNLMSIFMLKMINGGTLDDFGTIKSVDANNRKTVQPKIGSVVIDSDIKIAQG